MPRKHFTHLLEPDATLLAAYLEANPHRYDHLDFDVRVGLGRDPGPDFDSSMRKMALALSQRRIDCIGFRSNRIDIIEVTLSAGLTALGQMLAYPQLYQETFNPTLPLVSVLVTYELEADTEQVFRGHGIEVNIMPRPGP